MSGAVGEGAPAFHLRLGEPGVDGGLPADSTRDHDRCEVATEPGWRRITCDYTVRIQVLPGVWRALRLRIDVEEPYLADSDPLIL